MIQLYTASEIITKLSQKIEKVRKDKKITQRELADRAGMPYGTYRGLIDSGTMSLNGFISLYQVLDLSQELESLIKINTSKTIKELKEQSKTPKRIRKAKNHGSDS